MPHALPPRNLQHARTLKKRTRDMLMSAAAAMVVSPAAEKLFQENSDRARYARCIKASKRVRWDIDADVFRGRSFDFRRKFLPDGLTKVEELPFLSTDEQRAMSHVQGRTYACLFGLVERFINAKTLELASRQGLATSWRWKGWCASATRSSSIRRSSAASRSPLPAACQVAMR